MRQRRQQLEGLGKGPVLGGERRAFGDGFVDGAGRVVVEGALEVLGEQSADVVVVADRGGHGGLQKRQERSLRWGRKRNASSARARCRRDFTVPRGRPVTSAISS